MKAKQNCKLREYESWLDINVEVFNDMYPSTAHSPVRRIETSTVRFSQPLAGTGNTVLALTR